MRRVRASEIPEARPNRLVQMYSDAPMSALNASTLRDTLMGDRPKEHQEETHTPRGKYLALRAKVSARLVEELAYNNEPDPVAVRERLSELVNELGGPEGWPETVPDTIHVIKRMYDDLLGFGPVDRLLADPSISEIMVNGPDEIWVERRGTLQLSEESFDDTEQLMKVIDRIVSQVGRRVDEASPMVDARLADGSRVNVVIPPVSLTGPTLTIRRFADFGLEVDDLIRNGTATRAMVDFLAACVRSRQNILVSGGTGSGKTTTLNILSSFLPDNERIVTVEDAAELRLRQRHVISMEMRPANIEGRGQIDLRDLVINSLRMRPDRIVVGEVRGGEALDMLQAMNTGHNGSMATLHANNAHESVSRLETMVLMAGTDLPTSAIRGQIGSAIHYIVQQARLRDGTRRIVSISEIEGYRDGEVLLRDIFRFEQRGVDERGRVIGEHVPCGVLPLHLDDLVAGGERLDPSLFGVTGTTAAVAPLPTLVAAVTSEAAAAVAANPAHPVQERRRSERRPSPIAPAAKRDDAMRRKEKAARLPAR
jgi:pilus assembly protein CpaF